MHLVDLRAQKTVTLPGLRTTFTLDLFNLLNTGVTLRQIPQADTTTFRNPIELVPPRLLRLGVQIRF